MMSEPQEALRLLKAGQLRVGPEWAAAHEVCQRREGTRDYDLVHALCHWIEGDTANRDYWYLRVAPWVRAATLEDEWHAVTLSVK